MTTPMSHDLNNGNQLSSSPCCHFIVSVSHGLVANVEIPMFGRIYSQRLANWLVDGMVDFERYSSQPLEGQTAIFFSCIILLSSLVYWLSKQKPLRYLPMPRTMTPVAAAALTFDLGTEQVTAGRRRPLPFTSPAHLTGWLINPPHPAGRITLPARPDLRWPRRTFR